MKNALLSLVVTIVTFQYIKAQTPTIATFSPASGSIGSSVTITGTGFDANEANNVVFFGATKAAVTAASPTSLTVTVPTGATYQYISVTNLANNLTAYSAKPFIVTLDGAIAFDPKQDYAAGGRPVSIQIGDIDGDGKSDVVTANYGSNSPTETDGTFSVLRNTSTPGTVGFAPKIDFITQRTLTATSIGDIDGDGKLDVAVCGSGYLSLFRNTSTVGTISFANKIDFETGFSPYSISIGDIDGDGKPDIAVANLTGNSVSVFRNISISGTISFMPKADFTTDTQPRSVSIGDIDGDGKPDLAVAGLSYISILRNISTAGTINFAPKVDFTRTPDVYSYPSSRSVSIGDMDGDGKLDLAVSNGGGFTASVFRNTSVAGTVSFADRIDFTTEFAPYFASISDINGDGKPDIAVANSGSYSVSVLRNTSTLGTISFANKIDFTVGTEPYSVSIGDIDGDGKPDLAVANSRGPVSILKQSATPISSLTANGPFCTSGNGQLTWTSSAGTGPYTVVYNDGTANRTVTNVTSGTPFNVANNPLTNTTTYTLVSVTYPDNSVQTSGFTLGTATITINPLPTATVSGGGTVCFGSTLPNVSIALTGTGPWNVSYSNGSTSTTINNITTSPYIITGAGAGSYTVTALSGANCTGTSFTGSANVTVRPLPIANISGTAMVCKDAIAPNITFTGSSGTAPYTFTYRINNGSNQTITTTGINTSITIPQSTSIAGTFNYTLVSVSDANGCSQNQNGNATISVAGLPTLNITNNITSGTELYQAGQITANNQISNANVMYKAEQSVVLLPGFSATGNTFKASIGGCN